MLKFSSLFIILSTFDMINGEFCNTLSCPTTNSMSTKYAPSISVEYPFSITNQQRMSSCGHPGFDLYCDYNQGGTFIKLPNNNVTFRVDSIYYSLKQMYLTDPNGCLPGKLISLNLAGTPFRLAGSYNKTFLLYNCTGGAGSAIGSDRIDCLSGPNYSVISTSTRSGQKYCELVTTLTLPFPSLYYFDSSLNYLSGIYLAWNNEGGLSSASSTSPTSPGAVVGMVFVFLVVIALIILCCCCLYKNNNSTVHTGTNTSTESSTPTTTLTNTVTGLNKITIDSYPVVVLGESGRLIKPDDNTCAICLSDYCPKETLKIMPECLHRFHVECIDQWLGSKGICPICRNPTPCSSTPPN